MQDGQGRGEKGQHPASLYGAGGQHTSLFPCLVQEGQGGELEGQHPAPLSGTVGSVVAGRGRAFIPYLVQVVWAREARCCPYPPQCQVLCKQWVGGEFPPVLKNSPPVLKNLQTGGFIPPCFWMAKSQIFRLRRATIERILVTTSNNFRLQRVI